MRVSHAIFVRIPESVKSEDKKRKIDMELLRKQQEEFRGTLHEAGVHLIELPLLEGNNPPASTLLIGDLVIIIQGVALLTRPKKDLNTARMKQIAVVLADLTWTVHESPATENGKTVVLEAADVLFTGREIFVGIRKGSTNMEGAMVLARIFRDFPVVPIMMNDKAHPLTYFVSLVSDSVLSIGTTKEAQAILRKIEHDSSFRYKVISVEEDEAVACLNVNDRLIFKADMQNPKFNVLQGSGLELWALDVSELAKAGKPFARHCLMLDCTAGRSKNGTMSRSSTANGKPNGNGMY